MRPVFLCFLFFCFCACSDDDNSTIESNSAEEVKATNILLIIADDLGKDALNGFDEGNLKPNTPHLDSLRNNGLNFINFWSYPTCSPTRSSILTGKYGLRTGVKSAGDVLSISETSLQSFIKDNSELDYSTALIGKWHLSGNDITFNPEIFGIDYYAGLMRGATNNYYQWQLTQDGSATLANEYITETFTNLSINWINDQNKPWFLWLAYNAPHTPFHLPPTEMHNQGNLPDFQNGMDPTPYYLAAIEAMDFQIGRLLDSIPNEELQHTVILFLGDNGTPGQVAQFPYTSSKSKGSLYQGGINVPFIVSGKGLSRYGEDINQISSSDLYATIGEIAGVTIPQIHDSKSFKALFESSALSLRDYIYSESNEGVAISNGEYKLISFDDGTEEYYHLPTDPYEQNDLIESGVFEFSIKEKLENKILEIQQ